MAFVRILNTLLRDKKIGKHVVPIVPDESRTFGMEGMFRQFGIFSQVGQLYQPEDADQLMFYKEDKQGQVLQEGINEPGAFSSWIAAGTSYSNHDVPMIPFYIYYSMFGFQRIGDLAWAAGDIAHARLPARRHGRAHDAERRGPAARGRPLAHPQSSTIPNCVSYDPTYAHEVAVIVQDGLRRMLVDQEDVFYYLTLMNENYPHPGLVEGSEEGILKGMYLLREGEAPKKASPRVQLLGSGTILREVLAGRRPARRGLRRRGRRVERHELHRAASRGHRRGPLEHAAPDGGGAGALRHAGARGPRGPGDRLDRLHARVRGRHPPVRRPPRTACSGRTATAAATSGASCGASSRSTATTSRSPR